jgi:hypothetical protein
MTENLAKTHFNSWKHRLVQNVEKIKTLERVLNVKRTFIFTS